MQNFRSKSHKGNIVYANYKPCIHSQGIPNTLSTCILRSVLYSCYTYARLRENRRITCNASTTCTQKRCVSSYMPFIYHARIKKGSGPPNLKNQNFLYLHSKIHSNITENMPRNLTLHPPFQANLNIYSIPPGKKKFWIPA